MCGGGGGTALSESCNKMNNEQTSGFYCCPTLGRHQHQAAQYQCISTGYTNPLPTNTGNSFQLWKKTQHILLQKTLNKSKDDTYLKESFFSSRYLAE